jgi:hypothetical protein
MPRTLNDICRFTPIVGMSIRDEAPKPLPEPGQLVRVILPVGAHDVNMTWCFIEDATTLKPLGLVPCDALRSTHVRDMEVNAAIREADASGRTFAIPQRAGWVRRNQRGRRRYP